MIEQMILNERHYVVTKCENGHFDNTHSAHHQQFKQDSAKLKTF